MCQLSLAIWVHNQNCGGLSFEVRNTPHAATHGAVALQSGTATLQANGSEHKAAQVSTQRLADGSILVVDLETGICPQFFFCDLNSFNPNSFNERVNSDLKGKTMLEFILAFAHEPISPVSAESPLLYAQQTNASKTKATKIKVCGVADEAGNQYNASVYFDAFHSVWNKEGKDKFDPSFYESDKAITKIISAPKHGELDPFDDDSTRYYYLGNKGYEGADFFVIRIEVPGRKPVEVQYQVMVFDGFSGYRYEHDCNKPPFKMPGHGQSEGAETIANWQTQSQLSALLAAASGVHTELGGTGLARNDAFLNLQANGSEHKAAQVSTQRLADGSILVVDLEIPNS